MEKNYDENLPADEYLQLVMLNQIVTKIRDEARKMNHSLEDFRFENFAIKYGHEHRN